MEIRSGAVPASWQGRKRWVFAARRGYRLGFAPSRRKGIGRSPKPGRGRDRARKGKRLVCNSLSRQAEMRIITTGSHVTENITRRNFVTAK